MAHSEALTQQAVQLALKLYIVQQGGFMFLSCDVG